MSLVAAGVLNIAPVVDKAKFHGKMFRLWSDLRTEAVLESCIKLVMTTIKNTTKTG